MEHKDECSVPLAEAALEAARLAEFEAAPCGWCRQPNGFHVQHCPVAISEDVLRDLR
jgi:hypothetical protein